MYNQQILPAATLCGLNHGSTVCIATTNLLMPIDMFACMSRNPNSLNKIDDIRIEQEAMQLAQHVMTICRKQFPRLEDERASVTWDNDTTAYIFHDCAG